MKTSCGIIIVNEYNEIFMGHSTGNKFYDIPKGMLEDNESPLDCAIRECDEETSVKLNPSELNEIGLLPYNKEKNLHLFLAFKKKDSLDINSLICTSMFEHPLSKKILPEVDSFTWVGFSDVESKCAKSMGKLLRKLINESVLKPSKKLKPI